MRKPAMAMAALALVAAGCGKSTKTTSAGSPPVQMTGTVNSHGTVDESGKGSAATLEVEQDDYYFGPTFIKAAAGQKLTINLKNTGGAPHTFTTSDGSVDQQLSPGSKATVTLTVPSSGVVTYFCRFHHGQGMQGAVYLNAGDTAPAAGSTSSGGGSSGGSSTTATSSGSGYGY
jgi:plastocyanin